MRSRFGGAVAAVLVAGSGLIAAGAPASASTPPIAATGAVTCTVHAGHVSFKPKLTAAPQANVVATVTLALKPCTGTTGVAAATLTGATFKAVSAPYSASCTSPQPPVLTGTVKWKAKKAKFATSTISWSATSGDANHIGLSEAGSTITGSYTSDSAVANIVRLKSNDCVKGISSWKLDPITSSFAVNVPVTSCGNPPVPNSVGLATGQNGNQWVVVVPSVQYPASCHPTGTMSLFWNSQSCAGLTNVALQDASTTSATVAGQPVTNGSFYWGLDTGMTPSAAAACGISEVTYSGDATYAPTNLTGCGTNIATQITSPGPLPDPDPSLKDIWFLVKPAQPYTAACHPTGTIDGMITGGSGGECDDPFGGALVDSGMPNPSGQNYWGVKVVVTALGLQICSNLAAHGTYSGDVHYQGFTF